MYNGMTDMFFEAGYRASSLYSKYYGLSRVPVGFFVDKVHWDRTFSEYFSFPPVGVIPPMLHTHTSVVCHGCYIISAVDSVVG
jgi:hypothetical protein